MHNLTDKTENKKPRLGRGLGSLLGAAQQDQLASSQSVPAPAAPQPVPTEARVWQVPVEKLVPSQFQPRSVFQKEKLEELAQSIKERGIVQPILVRKMANGAFEIIAGERRWRAAQIAGLYEVPVIIKTIDNKETLELAIIENVQREDLSPIEEAEAYQRLVAEFSLTQQQVAEKVGKDRATITNALRLLQLPPQVREFIVSGELSAGHAKVLLGIEDAAQMIKLAQKAKAQQMSVRALEKDVQSLKKPAARPAPAAEGSERATAAAKHVAQALQKELGTKVSIDYANGKGVISIHFYSNDELTEISEKVLAGCKK